VVVYLPLGLLFAILFDTVERLSPLAFTSAEQQPGQTPAGGRFVYVSLFALTSMRRHGSRTSDRALAGYG
jgi:hypothetical protein